MRHLPTRRLRILVFVLVAVSSTAALARQRLNGQAGQRLLAGGTKGLGELPGQFKEKSLPELYQLPPLRSAAAANAGQPLAAALQAAIDERNRIIDKLAVFDTRKKLLKETATLAELEAACTKALKLVKGWEDEFAALKQDPFTYPDRLDKALQKLEESQPEAWAVLRAWQNQGKVVAPLRNQWSEAIRPWLQAYQRMREVISPDRRNPQRKALLLVLQGAIDQRADFHEGRVLAALLHVYDGNEQAAKGLLVQVGDAIDELALADFPFADDWCHGYLLLGCTDEGCDRIDALRDPQPKEKTTLRCWHVGLHGVLTGAEPQARDHMKAALIEIGCFNKNKVIPLEAAPLLGDAAFFWLTVNNEGIRNVDQARKILERSNPAWDVWHLARARAALAAADGDWPEAVKQIDLCAQACPPSLAEEVAAQRKAYGARERWIRPRPEAKGHANR